ncbi:hypothetical protein LT18_06554 [Pseudomonas aeruginosa]|nr:hypothetical protein LT18_06554 [Pseudomonas aeruginosa]
MSATGQSRCPLPGRPGARRDNRDPSARRRHRLSAPPATPRPTPGCVAWRYPPVRPDQRLRPAACAPVRWPGGSVPGSSARSRHAPPPSPPGSAPPAPRPRDAGRQARHRGRTRSREQARRTPLQPASAIRRHADSRPGRSPPAGCASVPPDAPPSTARTGWSRRSATRSARHRFHRYPGSGRTAPSRSPAPAPPLAAPAAPEPCPDPRSGGCTSPGTMDCGSGSAAAATPPPVARTAGPDGPALPVRYV